MAKFEIAVMKTLKKEDSTLSGVITVDHGGRTRFGIAEKYNAMPPEFWSEPASDAMHRAEVVYWGKYWRYDGVTDQTLANKMFDLGVNLGISRMVRMMQEILVGLGANVTVDGKWGVHTEFAVNSHDPTLLLGELVKKAKEHYETVAQADPTQEKFLKGWLNRADA